LKQLLVMALAAVCGCAGIQGRPTTTAAKLNLPVCAAAPSREHFYVLVFATQSTPSLARYSHSWATVVRVTDCGADAAPIIESQTISWMPATLEIEPLRLCPEPPVNLTLTATLDYAVRIGNERIVEWGPYECRPEYYQRFLAQKTFLESGQVGYQCVDYAGESGRCCDGTNCIHALTDVDPALSPIHFPLLRYGEPASRLYVKQLWERDILIQPEQTHDWLNQALYLDRYPIIHRRFGGVLAP
jgi:hypothetical protein